MVRNLAALLLLVCWLGTRGTATGRFAPHLRIKGGKECPITEFPFQVSLQEKKNGKFQHSCGASIIQKSWVLTEAYFVNGRDKASLRVKSGTGSREGGGNIHHVSEFIIHPEYDSPPLQYNVAVVKVTEPFLYSDVVKPIALAETTPAVGTPVSLSGWGELSEGVYPESLQCVNLTIIDHDRCKQLYKEEYFEHSFCAGETGVNARSGDDGSGLTSTDKEYLVAVSCRWSQESALFTAVAGIRDWVMGTIKSTESCEQNVNLNMPVYINVMQE